MYLLTRFRPDNTAAQQLTGLGIVHHLDEAFIVVMRTGLAGATEVGARHIGIEPGLLGEIFGQSHRRNFKGGMDDRRHFMIIAAQDITVDGIGCRHLGVMQGSIGSHRAGLDVTDGVNAGNAGFQVFRHLDETLRIQHHPGFFQAQSGRHRPPANGNQHMFEGVPMSISKGDFHPTIDDLALRNGNILAHFDADACELALQHGAGALWDMRLIQ